MRATCPAPLILLDFIILIILGRSTSYSVTITESNKLQGIQRKFAALCQNIYFFSKCGNIIMAMYWKN
jgi:hypothetical protein